jgi:hypothetical protein
MKSDMSAIAEKAQKFHDTTVKKKWRYYGGTSKKMIPVVEDYGVVLVEHGVSYLYYWERDIGSRPVYLGRGCVIEEPDTTTFPQMDERHWRMRDVSAMFDKQNEDHREGRSRQYVSHWFSKITGRFHETAYFKELNQ